MFKTILVPIDGSDTSLVAVDYAIELSKSFQAEIIGLSIMDIKKLAGPFMRDLGTSIGGMVPYADFQQNVRKFMEDKANAALDELEGKCDSKNVSCSRMVKEGIISKEIVNSIERCDMISMGMSGEHALWRDVLLGSNLESVIRQTHKPIMVTPDTYNKITKIFIAFDGSSFSVNALHTGMEIAKQLQLPLTVITISDDRESGEKTLSRAVADLEKSKVEYLTVLDTGDPVGKILDVCKKEPFNLLVMGAYGHSKIREFVIGSTTVGIMRKSNWPLLLCR